MTPVDIVFVAAGIGGGWLYWSFVRRMLAKSPPRFTLPTAGGRFVTRGGNVVTVAPAMIYGDFIVRPDTGCTSYTCDKHGKAYVHPGSGEPDDKLDIVRRADEPFEDHMGNILIP